MSRPQLLLAFGRGVRRSFLHQRNEQELTQNVNAAAAAAFFEPSLKNCSIGCTINVHEIGRLMKLSPQMTDVIPNLLTVFESPPNRYAMDNVHCSLCYGLQ
ncbi:hypothetical protein YC2023_064703 [Brassica napus]